MKRASLQSIAASRKAASRLCHLSMRYVGALLESVSGKLQGFLPIGHPGLHESRDLINLLLITRAEISGVTRALVEADLVSPERLTQIFAEEYEQFAQEKAAALGVEVTDTGITFNVEELRKRQQEKN